MTKQELLSRYQERFGSKELSFGCVFINSYGRTCRYISKHYNFDGEENGHRWIDDGENYVRGTIRGEIIGHPITQGRLFQELKRLRHYYGSAPYSGGKYTRLTSAIDLIRSELFDLDMLDKTIYERVESEKVFEILLELKDKLDG